MRNVTVAATQMACSWDREATLEKADRLVREAAANIMPVIASNRVGYERQGDLEMTFYGSSFIADETGEIVEEADRESETVLVHTFDLDAIDIKRRQWGVYRDRRPSMYGRLMEK